MLIKDIQIKQIGLRRLPESGAAHFCRSLKPDVRHGDSFTVVFSIENRNAILK